MFGLDSKVIAQVVADVAEIKAKLLQIETKIDKLSTNTSIPDLQSRQNR